MAMAQCSLCLRVTMFNSITNVKIRIMIAPSLIDLRALVKSSHVTINQKDHILVVHFHHLGTMTLFTIICRTSNIYFASCPSMHACTSLLPEALTHFPWIQTMLSWQNLSSTLKNIFMHTTM